MAKSGEDAHECDQVCGCQVRRRCCSSRPATSTRSSRAEAWRTGCCLCLLRLSHQSEARTEPASVKELRSCCVQEALQARQLRGLSAAQRTGCTAAWACLQGLGLPMPSRAASQRLSERQRPADSLSDRASSPSAIRGGQLAAACLWLSAACERPGRRCPAGGRPGSQRRLSGSVAAAGPQSKPPTVPAGGRGHSAARRH